MKVCKVFLCLLAMGAQAYRQSEHFRTISNQLGRSGYQEDRHC